MSLRGWNVGKASHCPTVWVSGHLVTASAAPSLQRSFQTIARRGLSALGRQGNQAANWKERKGKSGHTLSPTNPPTNSSAFITHDLQVVGVLFDPTHALPALLSQPMHSFSLPTPAFQPQGNRAKATKRCDSVQSQSTGHAAAGGSGGQPPRKPNGSKGRKKAAKGSKAKTTKTKLSHVTSGTGTHEDPYVLDDNPVEESIKRTEKDPFMLGEAEDEEEPGFRYLIMHEPCFDQLRTKEQLGYIVYCGSWSNVTTFGVYFIIQSEKTAPYLATRIEKFLEDMGKRLENMTEEEFEKNKRSLIERTLEKAKSSEEESNWHWQAIQSEYYMFNDLVDPVAKVLPTNNKPQPHSAALARPIRNPHILQPHPPSRPTPHHS
ncbi:hypothetical protein B0T21DRAFT_390010 [Apiosordaria backusii]|uniref:Coenzyme PQQ synthesis protein F-like C-terminal lobe domain-containing protein n=1 Tax=Apiosordaria backusii TaxID=314023 RepID=A0AA40ESN3_9PEZI|nr:hypothetical protein B0T21DRAFT_390010 [Apiosordaria backusii]